MAEENVENVEQLLRPLNSKDIGWDHGGYADPANKDRVKCKHCSSVCGGGIYRLKQHISGVKGEVQACRKAPEEARKACNDAIEASSKKKKVKHEEIMGFRDEVRLPDEQDIDESVGSSKRKKLGPLDWFFPPDLETNLPKAPTKQETILDHFARERWHYVASLCAHWVYEAGIPFNAIASPSFAKMCEAIGRYGPGWFPPSQYQLREPLLREDKEKTKEELKPHSEEWDKTGCSIMTDAWSDRKRRSIMNMCIHSNIGTMFLESKETGADSHTGEYIFNHVKDVIHKIGEDKVVQIVTDNASNNMAAGKTLAKEYPNIYWTSCAAHTINLMLTGIGNLPKFKDTIVKAQTLVIFIYAHHSTLAMMRGYTKKKDIVRPGITRFASAFLSLASLMEKKENLRFMFTSEAWANAKLSKCKRGRAAMATVLSTNFWMGVKDCLNVFGPLVKLLRMVDSDKPSMGFVYGEFLVAIKEIKKCFREITFKQIMAVIDKKKKEKDSGKERIASSLHLAGYFLNPYYFYKDPKIQDEENVTDAVLECIEKFFPGDETLRSTIANKELLAYKDKKGAFGKTMALNGCKNNDDDYDPVGWWSIYGSSTPNLKRMAQRILALTASSSGCERNWSCFEGVHTKKRNRLDAARLNDLVYVQFNAKLKSKRNKRLEGKLDPLASDDSTFAQGWFVSRGEEDFDLCDKDIDDENVVNVVEDVEPISGISWNVISDVTGADNVLPSRRSSRNQEKNASTSIAREVEDNDFQSEEESDEEQGFASDENDFEEGY